MTPREILLLLKGASDAQSAGIVGGNYYHNLLVDLWQENIKKEPTP